MSEDRFTIRNLPFPLRCANHTAKMLETVTGAPTSLRFENVIKAAEKRSGLPGKFDKEFLHGLEILCDSIAKDAKLHYFGRKNLGEVLVSGLEMRLLLDKVFEDNPTLNEQKLIPPLVVTGLPRSGTTFLHRLLCETEDARSIPFYEGLYPVPRKPIDYRTWDTRLKFGMWHWAGTPYNLDAMHYIRPMLPDECNFPLRLGLKSNVYWSMAPNTSYFEWLYDEDLRDTYKYYRRVLLFLQSISPERRITLKCPSHLAHLEALLEAIPEAMVVQTHRDPLASVPSDIKLILSMQALATNDLDCSKTINLQFKKILGYALRSVDLSKKPLGDKILHIKYKDVISDPVKAVGSIRTHFGLDFTEDHTQRLSKYAQKNKQYKHGKNPYRLEWFNLDEKTITEEFAPYIETFLKES